MVRGTSMQTRGRSREQHKPQPLELAEASKSALQDLSLALCQRNRLSQQAQRALEYKNVVVQQLDQFITDHPGLNEREEHERQTAEAQETHRVAIERLEKQLRDQNAEFEQERARLQQQATISSTAQADLSSSLSRVLPQLRGLLEAYDLEQRGQETAAAPSCTLTSPNRDVTRRLSELQTAFDEERAQLLEQASDAANTQQVISRQNLTQREATLTCPISLDLFENPVVTECCGKTFSSEALRQALLRNAQCPVCRAYGVASHATRDMADLVELHRTERSLLGVPENAGTAAAVAAVNERTATSAVTGSKLGLLFHIAKTHEEILNPVLYMYHLLGQMLRRIGAVDEEDGILARVVVALHDQVLHQRLLLR